MRLLGDHYQLNDEDEIKICRKGRDYCLTIISPQHDFFDRRGDSAETFFLDL